MWDFITAPQAAAAVTASTIGNQLEERRKRKISNYGFPYKWCANEGCIVMVQRETMWRKRRYRRYPTFTFTLNKDTSFIYIMTSIGIHDQSHHRFASVLNIVIFVRAAHVGRSIIWRSCVVNVHIWNKTQVLALFICIAHLTSETWAFVWFACFNFSYILISRITKNCQERKKSLHGGLWV